MVDNFRNKIICGNCLDVMQEIPDKSINLVLTDMPYGSTYGGKKWEEVTG